MQDLIQDDLRNVLEDWRAGKPVRSIILGHAVRLVPGQGNERASEEPIIFRQKKALAYVFDLLTLCGAGISRADFEKLSALAWKDKSPGLTVDEREAAEGLAWKVLLRGWNLAISGFADYRYIAVENPDGERQRLRAAAEKNRGAA